MDQKWQEKVVHNARQIMAGRWPELSKKPGGCLYFAACTVVSLRNEGVRAVLQAGSCHWPRITLEQAKREADPIYTFGYEWEPDSATTRRHILLNMLPEMHVWAAIPATNEIVDLTSGQFPAQCRLLQNLDWPGIQPPDYFWCKADKDVWPKNVCYEAKESAIRLAAFYLEKSMEY